MSSSYFFVSIELNIRFGMILFLVSSSIARRFVIAKASTNVEVSSSSPTIKSEKLPQIKVALCIQRYAHLSPEMNQLEKDYTDLLAQLEVENSYLSDHELRHKSEM
jgi:hypothetical protein